MSIVQFPKDVLAQVRAYLETKNRETEKKLKELKTTRDNKKAESTLLALRKTAEGNANLMPLILEAVKAYATLGETCDVLREVFGEYEGTSVI